jgi:UDP-N-acetyl-2-amino-2-deoxyglucuronate dehydrogenase
MTQKLMGVALVGKGMIAQTLVRALSAAQDVAHLKAIVSRHPDRARPLAEYYAG